MALPVWSEVRESLTAAIRAALPLQIRKASGERIAGVGLHIDAYYGSAGLYLLPELAACALDGNAVDNIGDWPTSTDWVLTEDHAQTFISHWARWDKWFSNHLDDFDETSGGDKAHRLLRVACEAMQQVEVDGLLNTFLKTERFKIIIAEHDDPNELSLERYELFVRTGAVRCDGDVTKPSAVSD